MLGLSSALAPKFFSPPARHETNLGPTTFPMTSKDFSAEESREETLHLNQFYMSSIPTEIGLMTWLTSIYGRKDDNWGTIPTEIGLLTELRSFRIVNFNCMFLEGGIPSEFGLLTKLTALSINYQSFEHCTIPSELGKAVRLEELDLYACKLEGETFQ